MTLQLLESGAFCETSLRGGCLLEFSSIQLGKHYRTWIQDLVNEIDDAVSCLSHSELFLADLAD